MLNYLLDFAPSIFFTFTKLLEVLLILFELLVKKGALGRLMIVRRVIVVAAILAGLVVAESGLLRLKILAHLDNLLLILLSIIRIALNHLHDVADLLAFLTVLRHVALVNILTRKLAV